MAFYLPARAQEASLTPAVSPDNAPVPPTGSFSGGQLSRQALTLSPGSHLWDNFLSVLLCCCGGSEGKESACKCGRLRFDPWVGKIPWKRKWQPAPVFLGFPVGSAGKASACNAGDLGSIPGLERSPEKGKATHPSILAWETPWTEEPGGLQSMGSQRVTHE